MVDREHGEKKGRERARSINIYIEIVVLVVAIIANMVTTILIMYYGDDPSPFATPAQLRVAQVVELFVIGLASLGLIYKSFWAIHEVKDLRQTVSDFKNLSEVRETFIHMAQHRLRTPLSGVRWAISLLKSSPRLSEQERNMMEKSEQKMEMAETLVEKMMKLHKSDLSDFELSEKRDAIDLSMLIHEIIHDLDYLAHDKKTEISFDPSVQVTIDGDRYLLKSALTNVIDNAIRYSPGGSVEVILEAAKPGATIIVRDTGVGISKKDLEHIFERFYRGQNAQSIDPNQSGIGMYLTKQVVGLHGGTINVSSRIAQGTTFTITLPKE